VPDQFSQWVRGQSDVTQFQFLIDYEFSLYPQNGIDLIKGLSIHRNSILVTSHADEVNLQEKCMEVGVQIIPKDMISKIKIFNRGEVI
jgi:hypothetical protein